MHRDVLVLAFLLAGCAAPGPLLFKEAQYPPLGLEARAASVEIRDARPVRGEVEVPFFAGSRRSFTQPLSPADSATLAGQVRRNLTGDGVPFHLKVVVDRGDVAYEAGFLRNRETAQVKITISLWHGTFKAAECNGSSTLEKRSPRVSRESMQALFAEALAMGVYTCLESTKEELKKSPGRLPGGRI